VRVDELKTASNAKPDATPAAKSPQAAKASAEPAAPKK
jgi:hypothetical protein